MESSKSYVVLYNPKSEKAAQHKCDLPTISGNRGGGFSYRAVIECDQCAKKWYAIVWTDESYEQKNEWVPLKWYHIRLRYKVWVRRT